MGDLVIHVAIAEDSSFQRKIIGDMLGSEPSIEIAGFARNGEEAIDLVSKTHPDVLVLDLIMPRIDGFEAFKRIMSTQPLPTIIFSVLDPASLDKSIQALMMGAVDFITKPAGVWKDEFPKYKELLIKKIQTAATSSVRNIPLALESNTSLPVHSGDFPAKEPLVQRKHHQQPFTPPETFVQHADVRLETNVVVIGASVGGPSTLRKVLSRLPASIPAPILVVQHMPSEFTALFASTLDKLCRVPVKVGENNEYLLPGRIYIAPGDKHMQIMERDGHPSIKTSSGEPVNFCIPSVDVLFQSAPRIYRENVLAVLLTGMGNDGVEGMRTIQKNGGLTIAESKESCILYGMPRSAAEAGVADVIIPNDVIPEYITRFSRKL